MRHDPRRPGDFQCAYLIRKGSDAALRTEGIEAFRRRVAATMPWLGDRMRAVRDWSDVALLDVRLDRLCGWFSDGLLCLGDAANAMSPVGGVGSTSPCRTRWLRLAGPLRRGNFTRRDLARVQVRRWLPTALTQTAPTGGSARGSTGSRPGW